MFDVFARVLLAVVFLAAVVGKVRSRRAFADFRDSVAAIAPRGVPALVVVAAETATVVLLAVSRLAGYALAAVLLVAFSAGIAAAVHNRQSVRCRCFGAGGDVLGPKHLVRNGLLIAVAAGGALTTGVVPAAPVALAAATAGALLGLLTTRWEDVVFLLVPAGRNR